MGKCPPPIPPYVNVVGNRLYYVLGLNEHDTLRFYAGHHWRVTRRLSFISSLQCTESGPVKARLPHSLTHCHCTVCRCSKRGHGSSHSTGDSLAWIERNVPWPLWHLKRGKYFLLYFTPCPKPTPSSLSLSLSPVSSGSRHTVSPWHWNANNKQPVDWRSGVELLRVEVLGWRALSTCIIFVVVLVLFFFNSLSDRNSIKM